MRRLAVAHREREKESLAWELERRYPVSENPKSAIARAIREGKSVFVPEVTDEWLVEMAQDDGQLGILRALDLGSLVIVPLGIHGRSLGAMTLGTLGRGRRYDGEDLSLAEDLARRASQAMDNARLYGEQYHAAHTLQRSLLPPELPELPGVEAAVRYRPAAGDQAIRDEATHGGTYGGYDVGGDFYDLFSTPVGWAAVVGDVMGKGVEAAELTAMARYTLRTAAMQRGEPSGVVSTLNAAIQNQRRDGRFCTVAFGLLNLVEDGPPDGPCSARLTLVRGGHPAPLVLRADGSVEEIGVPGTLVGVLPEARFENHSVDLAPEDAVVLYTDGLTEARSPRGELFGDERLKSRLRACSGLAADDIAGELERGVLEFRDGQRARDDLAVLVLRVSPR